MVAHLKHFYLLLTLNKVKVVGLKILDILKY